VAVRKFGIGAGTTSSGWFSLTVRFLLSTIDVSRDSVVERLIFEAMEMNVTQEPIVDNKRWAGFVVAVLMSRTTGDNLSGLMYSILPYDIANMIGPLIGYGFTGVLLGLCMFYFLGSKAKSCLKWLPLLLLGVVLLVAFLNLFSAGRAGSWSVFGIIGLLLSRLSGYSYLFFLPFVSGVTIYVLEAKKTGGTVDFNGFKNWLKSALVK